MDTVRPRLRVCTENGLWEKNPLPHWGLQPVSVLHLAFQLDSLPTELFLPAEHFVVGGGGGGRGELMGAQ